MSDFSNETFHLLATSDDMIPSRMNNPFHRSPTAIAKMAANILKNYIYDEMVENEKSWSKETTHGKMFGVLVVRSEDGATGFLGAYSGQIGGREDWEGFVPAVFDYLQPDGHFKTTEAEIVEINKRIKALQKDDSAECADDASSRKASAKAKAEEIAKLKATRRKMSKELQTWLFSQFVMINKKGERKDLNEIFRERCGKQPPSGSGECCAPKLLQYAFLHHYEPIAIAEFWLGTRPNSENRMNRRFYGACLNKCEPILHFMLNGEFHP